MEIFKIMGKIEERLNELGIVIPEAPKPVAAYIPAKKSGKSNIYSRAITYGKW